MAFLQSISDLKVRRRNEVDLNTGNDRYSGHGYSGIDRYSGTKNPDDAILFTVSGITAIVEQIFRKFCVVKVLFYFQKFCSTVAVIPQTVNKIASSGFFVPL